MTIISNKSFISYERNINLTRKGQDVHSRPRGIVDAAENGTLLIGRNYQLYNVVQRLKKVDPMTFEQKIEFVVPSTKHCTCQLNLNV